MPLLLADQVGSGWETGRRNQCPLWQMLCLHGRENLEEWLDWELYTEVHLPGGNLCRPERWLLRVVGWKLSKTVDGYCR